MGTNTELDELPVSAKLVYTVLRYQGTQTQTELTKESLLSSRTVRYALGRLQNVGLVKEEICLQDARKRRYVLTDKGRTTHSSPRTIGKSATND